MFYALSVTKVYQWISAEVKYSLSMRCHRVLRGSYTGIYKTILSWSKTMNINAEGCLAFHLNLVLLSYLNLSL